MLIGVTDPSHRGFNQEDDYGSNPVWYPLEDVVEMSRDTNPKWAPWTYELLQGIVSQHQERDYISTTMICGGCPRSSVLERKEEYIETLDRFYPAFRGTMVHAILEKAARPGSIAEARFHTTIDGTAFSCSPDLIEGGRMWDYKLCLDPTSKVLCADLVWREASTLIVGDEVIGFDDVERGSKFRTSTVLAAPTITCPKYEVTMVDGTTTTVSEGHRFYMHKKGGESPAWKAVETLHPGDQVQSFGPTWSSDAALGTLRPPRLLAHTGLRSIWEDRKVWGLPAAEVAEVRFLGIGPVIALSTSTKTFVADGLLGHNTESVPQYKSMWPSHLRQLQYNRFVVNNAEKWTMDGEPFDISIDPRSYKFGHLAIVYMGPKAPKIIETEVGQAYRRKDGEWAKNKQWVPFIASDEEVLNGHDKVNELKVGLLNRLDAMRTALDSYPVWPRGLEKFWKGPPSWQCPGPPWCRLPNCLAKRWPHSLKWER